MSAEQFDKMLSQMSGRPSAQMTDLQQLSDGMKTFINKVSGHEGVELPGCVLSHVISVNWNWGTFSCALQPIRSFLSRRRRN